jgi:hypothetical protein
MRNTGSDTGQHRNELRSSADSKKEEGGRHAIKGGGDGEDECGVSRAIIKFGGVWLAMQVIQEENGCPGLVSVRQ